MAKDEKKTFSPEEISAMLLTKMKETAEVGFIVYCYIYLLSILPRIYEVWVYKYVQVPCCFPVKGRRRTSSKVYCVYFSLAGQRKYVCTASQKITCSTIICVRSVST